MEVLDALEDFLKLTEHTWIENECSKVSLKESTVAAFEKSFHKGVERTFHMNSTKIHETLDCTSIPQKTHHPSKYMLKCLVKHKHCLCQLPCGLANFIKKCGKHNVQNKTETSFLRSKKQ